MTELDQLREIRHEVEELAKKARQLSDSVAGWEMAKALDGLAIAFDEAADDLGPHIRRMEQKEIDVSGLCRGICGA